MRLLHDIREVLGTLKHRGPSKKYCPRCGSPKIRLFSGLNYWLTARNYTCEDCGYHGPIVMELEKEEENEEDTQP